MPWFDCTASLVDLHSSALRRNSALSVPVGGHRCTVTLPNRKEGNVYFQKRIIQIHWTAKHESSKADNVLAGPLKAHAPMWTSSFGNVSTSLADAALMVLMVDQINSAAVHSAWRPDICWMTGCYALLVFLLGSSSFVLFHGTLKDMFASGLKVHVGAACYSLTA